MVERKESRGDANISGGEGGEGREGDDEKKRGREGHNDERMDKLKSRIYP